MFKQLSVATFITLFTNLLGFGLQAQCRRTNGL